MPQFRVPLAPTALAAALFLSGLAVPAVQAQTAAATQQNLHAIELPAQPLGDALNELARQAGLQLLVRRELVQGKQAPAVSGRLSTDQALERLLAGSGLTAASDGPAVVVRPAPPAKGEPAVLPTLRARASVEREDARGPVRGHVARRSATASKTDSELLDIPQTVSIVSAQQMADQGARSITSALGYTPGVVAQYGDSDVRHDWLTVRGFTPARYLDGLRLPFGARGYAQPRIESFGLERVEVLKGPASVLYGQAAPGGLVNMVRKRPTGETSREIQLQYGSYRRKQAAVDVGGSLAGAGEPAYRVVGVVSDGGTQFDHVEERKRYLAPSLSLHAGDTTRLTLQAEYQKIDSPGGGGAPALPLNGTLDSSLYPKLSRSTFVGEPGYDRFENEQWFVGYEFEHRLDAGWVLRQNLRYGDVDTDTQRVQAFCLSAESCDPSALLRYAWAFPERSRLLTVDNQAVRTLETGAVHHTLLLGVDYARERSAFEESQLSVLWTPFNAYSPTYGTAVSRPAASMLIDQKSSQIGVYAQDQIGIGALKLTVGGRYDRADIDTDTRQVTAGTSSQVRQRDHELTGRVGAVYRLDNGVAPYASYSTSFQPAGGTDRNGEAFDPTTGRQIEAGVKVQPPGSRSLFTFSVYQLTQQNVLTPDPVNTNYSTQSGEVRMRGVEIEGKFQLLDRLSMITSYAYTDSEITKDNPGSSGSSNEGNHAAFVPRDQASLWADYGLGGDFAGLNLGGGIRYVGRTWGNNANTTEIPGYSVTDFAVRYDLGRRNRSLQGLLLALNISNLFDKHYVSTCLSTTTACYWGEGRKLSGTLNYRW